MNFSFRGSAVAQDPGHDDMDAGHDRRNVVMLGGGAAAMALVGVMAFALTRGGGSTDVALVGPVATKARTATAVATTPDSRNVAPEPARPVRGGDYRDPFQPLAAERATATTTAATADTTTDTTADTTADTTTAAPPSVAATSSSTADPAKTSAQLPPQTQTPATPVRVTTRPAKPRASVSPVRVTVKDVMADNSGATVTVDGKKYPVAVGKVFAERFRLMALNDGRCAVVKYRGKGPFDLCEGKTRVIR
jgi:hypothetical protein